uniref:Centrosomal protein 112 n=1 Tax=Mastacembelus armatus TaxID=205130 RepID=A0A7N8XIG0_9TELE
MSKHEDSWQRLDTEFDHFLLDMKPYVLKHPNRTERQRCAIWIKKLCDPVTCGSGLIDRRNRNLYARLLLHMLKRGVLEAPFTSKPEPGNLKTLPTYMAIYFGEPLSGQSLEHSNAGLPDWVTGELGGYTDDSLAVGLLKDRTSSTPIAAHHRYLSSKVKSISQKVWFSVYFQIEMKIKVLEAKHQEEKLKMQQSHDADVEKILDRKNGEIEEMKSMYRAKQKESEEVIRKLEKKVQSVLRESQVICESKEKQIAELKKMSDQSTDSLKNEWEKKLHAAVTQMEQEKFELQKKHTVNIQELLEDTNLRLAKMEAEYIARSQATVMRELEMRVKHQSAEVEKGNALRQKVTQEKAQLEIQIASISAELQEANRRTMILQKEKEQQSEQYEQTIQKLQAKHETDMSHLHQEHTLSAAKASEVIEGLDKNVALLKQQLQDSEHRRHQQLRVCIMFIISVLVIHSEAEKEKTEARRKVTKLEDALREMESQLDRSRESQRQQIQQADMALEQFKKQVQLSSEKAYTDMKLQMEKVEEDLMRSKAHRETQAKEFNQQLDALSQKYEQQMAEQRMQYEQERTRLQQQHSTEKDSLVQEHQREASNLERQARATLQQHQQHTQEWRKRDAQIISDLETQLSSLREELQGAHTQYKQQLSEMALFTEEEKQRSFQEKEASLDRLRSDMERIRSDLERRHHQEMIAAQEKTNSRLKQIEKEYSQKLAKSAQLIAELQTSLCDSKEETVRLQQAMERQLEEANSRWDEERRTITHRADQAYKVSVGHVTVVRQEYEEKIKGLMPAELRQELEDTITSLKAQVRPDCRTYSIWRPKCQKC